MKFIRFNRLVSLTMFSFCLTGCNFWPMTASAEIATVDSAEQVAAFIYGGTPEAGKTVLLSMEEVAAAFGLSLIDDKPKDSGYIVFLVSTKERPIISRGQRFTKARVGIRAERGNVFASEFE